MLAEIFYFHPEPWWNDPILTNMFQMGWFNHQLVMVFGPKVDYDYFSGRFPWTWDVSLDLIV